jgi:Na+/H+-dicarboxylate symporter
VKKPEAGKAKSRRSGSVVVAGWFAILAVPLILARMAWLLMGGELTHTLAVMENPNVWLSTQGLDTLVTMLVLPIALISLVTGIAILRMKRWAWVVLMVFLVAALILNLGRSYVHEPEYALMLIYSVLALMLNQPDVRQAFRIGRPSHEPVD